MISIKSGPGPRVIAGEMREHDFSQISTACWLSDFQKDGYLLIRNAIPASNVAQARETLITEFGAAATSAPPLLGNRNAYSHPHLLHPVLEHPNLFKICQTLLIHASTTTFIPFPFKWLRAVKTDLYTGPHIDQIYFPSLSTFLTIWVPLNSCITSQMGGLVVCPTSHQYQEIQDFYSTQHVGKDLEKSGWVDESAASVPKRLGMLDNHLIQWVTSASGFNEGDVVVLHKDVLHMTGNNETDTIRLSCDTRWSWIEEGDDEVEEVEEQMYR